MDEKIKANEKTIMLVRELSEAEKMAVKAKQTTAADLPEIDPQGKLLAVSGIDEQGNITTIDPTPKNLSKMFDVRSDESALEAFMRKFLEQAETPMHTGIYLMLESVFSKLVKIDLDPEFLEKYRVDPAKFVTPKEFQPLDPAKIDRSDMERKGIRWEGIEPHLKAMTYGHKSPALIDMSPELTPGGTRVPTKGRVSLEQQKDGSVRVIPHYWQQNPNLDAPLYGVKLLDDVKKNLQETRHAGRLIDLEITPGKPEPCFVSVDKFTNTLEVLPASALDKRDSLKNAAIPPENIPKLYAGEKILLEKFTTRAGYLRDGWIRVNAADRNFEFSFEGLDRNRYAEENKQLYAEGKIAKPEAKPTSENGTDIHVHKFIKGAEVPTTAFKQWSEAVNNPELRDKVDAVYIKDMTDAKGEKFNAWVRPNFEKGKFDFFKFKPKSLQQAEVKTVQPQKEDVKIAQPQQKRTGVKM